MKLPFIYLLLILPLTCFAKGKNKMALNDEYLAAMWQFRHDPALHPLLWDSSHNGNHLTPHGFDPALSPPGSVVDGKVGKAIELNGEDQYFIIASNAGFSHEGNPFTFVGWFMLLELGNNKFLYSTTEWGVAMVASGSNHFLTVSIEDEDLTLSGVPLEIDTWYFLSLGWHQNVDNPSASRVWAKLDRSDGASSEQSGLTAAPGPFSIGAGTGGTGFVRAVFDDAAFFRRELTSAEFLQLFNPEDDEGRGLAFEDWDTVSGCSREINCCQ